MPCTKRQLHLSNESFRACVAEEPKGALPQGLVVGKESLVTSSNCSHLTANYRHADILENTKC